MLNGLHPWGQTQALKCVRGSRNDLKAPSHCWDGRKSRSFDSAEVRFAQDDRAALIRTLVTEDLRNSSFRPAHSRERTVPKERPDSAGVWLYADEKYQAGGG